MISSVLRIPASPCFPLPCEQERKIYQVLSVIPCPSYGDTEEWSRSRPKARRR